MGTRKRFIISLVLALCMVTCLAGMSLAQPTDIGGHWAENQINEWAVQGLVQGYTDGTFKPNNSITRAEFMAIVNRAFGFTTIAETDYSDVSDNDWFAAEVAKAKAAGYISGYEDGTMRPGQQISRQEVAAILARILSLDVSTDVDALNKFKDAGDIPEWSRGSINAVVAKNLMGGYPDQSYKPIRSITRAEAVVTLVRASKISVEPVQVQEATIYDQAGDYGPTAGEKIIDGNVNISAADVTLLNVRITGDLTLDEAIGSGNVTLKGVEVQGTTVIKGGGSHSIIIDSCTLPVVKVYKEDVRLLAAGKTVIKRVSLQSGAALIEENLKGAGFEAVTITEETKAEARVILNGDFSNIKVEAEKVKVEITGGTIVQLEAAEKASGAAIDIAGKGKVSTLTLNAAVSVSGKGTIETAKICVSGSTIEQTPIKVEKADNILVNIGAVSEQSKAGAGTGANKDEDFIVEKFSTPSLDADNTVLYFDFSKGVDTYLDDNLSKIRVYEKSTDNSVRYTNHTYIKQGNKDNPPKIRRLELSFNNLKAATTYGVQIEGGFKSNNGNELTGTQYWDFTTTGTAGGNSGDGKDSPAAPQFVSAEVTKKGDISITFDKDMADPKDTQDQFTVIVNSEIVAVQAVESTDTSTKIKLLLELKVLGGQTVTVAYKKAKDGVQVKSKDGGVLKTFLARSVTNNLGSAPVVPTFNSAITNVDGDKVIMSFSKEMAEPQGAKSEFNVLVNEENREITFVKLNLEDKKKIDLSLSSAVTKDDTATVSYTKGTVTAADGTTLESFGPQTIINAVYGAVPAPPTVEFAEVTTKKDVSITFNKAIADPSGIGAESQFIVKVGDGELQIKQVTKTNTPEKIKIELIDSDKVPEGQAAFVSYTKGSDESKWIKSTDGGILESFDKVETK